MSLVLVRFEDRSLSSKAKNQNAVGGAKKNSFDAAGHRLLSPPDKPLGGQHPGYEHSEIQDPSFFSQCASVGLRLTPRNPLTS